MLPLLALAACQPDTALYVVLVDGGSVRVPVQVASFAGVTVAGGPDFQRAPVEPVPLWLPIELTVPAGDTEAVTLAFGEDALRLRGETSSGSPFSIRVAMDSLAYGPAELDTPATVLVLDASKLLDGAALDELSAAADPTPDDGVPEPLDLDAASDPAVAFAAAAPEALWLGSPRDARTRFAGRWPYAKGRFGDEAPVVCGCAGGGGYTDTADVWVEAPDSAVPDSAAVPADSAWGGDTPNEGGCGGSSQETGRADSAAAGASGDSGSSGGDDGCACGGGGDDSGSDSSARVRPSPGVVFALTFGPPLVFLRRRR